MTKFLIKLKINANLKNIEGYLTCNTNNTNFIIPIWLDFRRSENIKFNSVSYTKEWFDLIKLKTNYLKYYPFEMQIIKIKL